MTSSVAHFCCIIFMFVAPKTCRSLPASKTADWSKAQPFHRSLSLMKPALAGRDVMILQNLLQRQTASLKATG